MGNLFSALRNQASANARRIVEICVDELPVYQAAAGHPDDYAQMLDFAVFIRERTFDLVTSDHPLTDDDLAVVAGTGEARGKKGMSQMVARRILALHAAATMREIHEASGPRDLNDAMHLLAWLGAQGPVAQNAYSLAFLEGQRRHLPIVAQIRQFAEMALADDPAAVGYAHTIGITTADRYLVVVLRAAGRAESAKKYDEDVLEAVWRHHHAVATWHRSDELVVLVPAEQEKAALALAREVAEITGRSYAIGSATGRISSLAETLTMARRVSRVARAQARPDHLCTVADVFIEIGVAEVPEIDRWLRALTRQLEAGPDLIPTLDAYYRHDLNRTRTATTLNVHARTLDYRLHRVHELTGIDPHTTHGIRVLSTAITRSRA
jgi:hypothetical protein